MSVTCNMCSVCKFLFGKLLLMTLRHRLEGISKMDAKESGCYGVAWTSGWLF